MELFDVVDRHCNIRFLKTNCNFRLCEKPPEKEMLIFEMTMSTAKKKDIISLYLCQEHYREMEKALDGVIGRFRNGRVYRIKKTDDTINVVTY